MTEKLLSIKFNPKPSLTQSLCYLTVVCWVTPKAVSKAHHPHYCNRHGPKTCCTSPQCWTPSVRTSPGLVLDLPLRGGRSINYAIRAPSCYIEATDLKFSHMLCRSDFLSSMELIILFILVLAVKNSVFLDSFAFIVHLFDSGQHCGQESTASGRLELTARGFWILRGAAPAH